MYSHARSCTLKQLCACVGLEGRDSPEIRIFEAQFPHIHACAHMSELTRVSASCCTPTHAHTRFINPGCAYACRRRPCRCSQCSRVLTRAPTTLPQPPFRAGVCVPPHNHRHRGLGEGCRLTAYHMYIHIDIHVFLYYLYIFIFLFKRKEMNKRGEVHYS